MSSRRKVLVIPSWYPNTGNPTAGIFIWQQVRALADVADVAVLHVDTGQEASGPTMDVDDDVTVVRAVIRAASVFNRYFGYRKAGLAAFEVLRKAWGEPEIVHVQALFPAAMIARDIRRRDGIPYVVTEHSEEYLAASTRRLVKYPVFVGRVLRPLAHGASRTVAVSDFLARRLVDLGLARDPVVIPNVVSESPATPLPLGTPHVIAHVSVMGPAKNLFGLIQAVDRLRGRRNDFVLRLVGDGECRSDAQVLVSSLALDGLVEFTGRKSADDVRDILSDSAFTVISSTHETFSVSAAESLMSGRPVVSTRCGGPEEFITSEVGRLVDAGSVEALVDGLDWMLDHYTEYDPARLHTHACERFAPDVVAARILDVYREVLGA